MFIAGKLTFSNNHTNRSKFSSILQSLPLNIDQIPRFVYARKNQETETLHCGAVFLEIFWNYRSAKCSIYGVIFGHDQGRILRKKVNFEVCSQTEDWHGKSIIAQAQTTNTFKEMFGSSSCTFRWWLARIWGDFHQCAGMIIVCFGILLPNFWEYCLFLTKKVLAILVQCQIVGFSVKIIAKAVWKR